jgi:hypothetical protein
VGCVRYCLRSLQKSDYQLPISQSVQMVMQTSAGCLRAAVVSCAALEIDCEGAGGPDSSEVLITAASGREVRPYYTLYQQ